MEKKSIYLPDWFKKSAVYQINPRTFSAEGTIAAVERELPSLRDLGFRIMYLCPVFEADTSTDKANWSTRQKASQTENPRNPYRMNDYFKIDDEYGTMDDLASFVQSAHALGMRVILDLVYLHIGPNAPVIARHPEFAQHNPDGSVRCTIWNFPYLNFDHPGLREYLWSNMAYYIGAIDADGFRCDVGDEVPDDFWTEGRRRIQCIKPDAVLINEGSKFARIGGSFDTCYNFAWHEDIYKCISGTMTAAEVAKRERERLSRVPEGGVLLRDMDNHDTVTDWPERAEIRAGHDGMEAILALNYCMPGIPMVYCGNELADAAYLSMFANRFHMGRFEVTDRAALRDSEAGVRRQEIVKKLNVLRDENEDIHSPWMEWLDVSEQVIAFRRGEGKTVFAVNMSTVCVTAMLPDDLTDAGILLKNKADIDGNTVKLDAYGYLLIER